MSVRQLGNYRILDYIGSGGFGSVFKAEDINHPGRIVAVKELHKKHTRSAVIKQRFFHEALAMARLDHINLPRLYTFGEDNGSYYLVMEFLSGRLLSEELHEKGLIDPPRAVAITSQVLDALGYAHRNGIIHRDLKPDNIMLVEDGGHLQVKVLDFGIARMVGGENLTLTGQGVGTPAYMSPERIKGEAGIDHRTDIYSAGIVLFEMLVGYTPFTSTASDPAVYWAEMHSMHEKQPLPTLKSHGISPELEAIVSTATAKRPEDRYSTAEEMKADLSNIGDKRVSDALGERLSRLMLVTAPAAADIFIDNLPRGTSDADTGKILIERLSPGLHEVRVSKSGYTDYKISVALEEGRKTDLQVSLAARVTMAVDNADKTAAMEAETERLNVGNEVATVVLTVQGLPEGSALFIDSQPVAVAGQDGRATVEINPGVHEVQAAAPSGDEIKRYITVQESDKGLTHTMTMALGSGSTVGHVANVTQEVGQSVATSEAPKTSKRVAAAVAVILLLALAATAFFVFRGPSQESAQTETGDVQPLVSKSPSAQEQAVKVREDAVKAAEDGVKAAEEAVKAEEDAEEVAERRKELEAEKKKLEAERKKLEEEKKATPVQFPGTPPPPEDAPAPASPPTPAQSETSDAPDPNTCVNVSVTGPQGQTAPQGVRIVLAEQPGSTRPIVQRGVTNSSGQWSACGLIPGMRARLAVFGPRGALLASRQVTVARGKNSISIQVNRLPGRSTDADSDDEESTRPRRRTPLPRQP